MGHLRDIGEVIDTTEEVGILQDHGRGLIIQQCLNLLPVGVAVGWRSWGGAAEGRGVKVGVGVEVPKSSG